MCVDDGYVSNAPLTLDKQPIQIPVQNQTADPIMAQPKTDLLTQQGNQVLPQEQTKKVTTYVQSYYGAFDAKEDYRTEYMRSAGLLSVRAAVERAMPDSYKKIDDIRSRPEEDMRKTTLHRGRTQSLKDESGDPLLKVDLAGSSFCQFRADYKGHKGKESSVKVLNKSYKVDKSIDEQLKKETKERWYHRSWLARFIPGIRTASQLSRDNLKLREGNEIIKSAFAVEQAKFHERVGTSQEHEGKVYKEVRKKLGKTGDHISIAGSLSIAGLSNSGDYSIEKQRDYAASSTIAYLDGILSTWKSPADARKVYIALKGHSRGAVASIEGAMCAKAWAEKKYPDFVPFIKFDITQYDPVPGLGSRNGVHEKVDILGKKNIVEGGVEMSPLGDNVESTVIYSIHSNHTVGFTPQAVMGAKRVILNPTSHSVNLNRSDTSKIINDGQESTNAHRQGYADAKTGETYRSSAVNDLEPGVYISDERDTLVRFDNYDQVKQVLDEVWKKTIMQKGRHNVLLDVAKFWFDNQAKITGADGDKK